MRADRDTVSRLIGGASWVKAANLAGVTFDIVGAQLSTNNFGEPELRFTLLLDQERDQVRLPTAVVVLGMEPTDVRSRIADHFQGATTHLGPLQLKKRQDGVWEFVLVE